MSRFVRAHALLLLAGVVWSLFCTLLARAGHAPSFTLLPLARDQHYAVQALLTVPLLLAQWRLCLFVVERLTRDQAVRAERELLGARISAAMGGPLLALFLLPDVITYAVAGFAALGTLVRFTAPLSFMATVALVTRAVRRERGVTQGRALVAALAGVLAQALAGAPFLR